MVALKVFAELCKVSLHFQNDLGLVFSINVVVFINIFSRNVEQN